jgi:hypothetical protein
MSGEEVYRNDRQAKDCAEYKLLAADHESKVTDHTSHATGTVLNPERH